MKKVKWQHPSAHSSETWVEGCIFKDEEGEYIAKEDDQRARVYLKANKGLKIIYEKD